MKEEIQIWFYVMLCLFLPATLTAQEHFFQGYVSDVSGTRFSYHSPLPDVQASLLSRANKNFDPIAWMTEVVPVTYKADMVTFIWLYGMDVLSESQDFDLYINDKKWLRFSSPTSNDKELWSVSGPDGSMLTFHRTMIDRHGDQMGFATLTLPASAILPGKNTTIKVDGVDHESDAWYMTYKAELREELKIYQNSVVAKKNDQRYHIARFDFTHLKVPALAIIRINGAEKSLTLQPGNNSIDFELPEVDLPTEFTAKVKIGNAPYTKHVFTLSPVRQWTIYLVQHSHTDIGYTRPQTEIMAEHIRYIDNALDYCDQTDDFPEDAKFRWTCEASWAVREYLNSRPQVQIDRLLKRIKEGRIEVTSMFFNFCDIVDETALAMQTKTLATFKAMGIDVTTAMQNDVNGIGWCMVDFYDGTDVKYLTMGQHGHRAQIPFDKPTSFWWESPSGKRLLAYRSEHYMHGNALSLTSGYLDGFRSNLSLYLDKLEKKGYPYDRTSFQFSGYVTDNSPPSTTACTMVKEWNEKYEWPKLRMALAGEFMMYIEKNEASSLPVKREAWPDWWTDGFGSAMNETKAARTAQADMIANTGLLSMAQWMGAALPKDIHQDITDCYDNLLFYDEHTFGAAESITDPTCENSIIQWGEKSAYAWDAVKESSLIREKAIGFIQPYIQRSDVSIIAVFNTLNWKRSGLVKVFIDHDVLPTNREFKIVDENGREMQAMESSSRSEGTFWNIWVKDIPAMGYKTLRIEVSDQIRLFERDQPKEDVLENQFYRLRIDKDQGVVTGLFDKELNLELIDQLDTVGMGRIIYEQLESRQAMERLTNTNRDTAYVPLKGNKTTLTDITVSDIEDKALWKSIRIHGQLPICADTRGVNIEIRLYRDEKRIEFLYDMHKMPVDEPEGVYVAFPFTLAKSHLEFDVQGGTVKPGVNQLEGTASDWNTIQHFASVKNEEEQIVFCSNDIPLVQFGAINTGRFYYKHQPEKPHIYSWVLNNYWTTNFKKSQFGEMKWTYTITSVSDQSNSFATRFGWGSSIPLVARVLPPGGDAAKTRTASLFDPGLPNLLLVSIKPAIDGNSLILHLRETAGDTAILDIPGWLQKAGLRSISESNVLEEEIQSLDKPFQMEPYASKFFKLKLME